MADRKQARERSDAPARALKGSLSSAAGEGLVCGSAPSVGLKVTRKQRQQRHAHLAWPAAASSPPPLCPPTHPQAAQGGCRGESLRKNPGLAPQPHFLVTWLCKVIHHLSLTCCLSTTLSFPSTEMQPLTLTLTISFTQPLGQPRLERSLLQVPIERMLLFLDIQQKEAHSLGPT